MKTSVVEIASAVEKLVPPMDQNFEKDDTISSNHSINKTKQQEGVHVYVVKEQPLKKVKTDEVKEY